MHFSTFVLSCITFFLLPLFDHMIFYHLHVSTFTFLGVKRFIMLTGCLFVVLNLVYRDFNLLFCRNGTWCLVDAKYRRYLQVTKFVKVSFVVSIVQCTRKMSFCKISNLTLKMYGHMFTILTVLAKKIPSDNKQFKFSVLFLKLIISGFTKKLDY